MHRFVSILAKKLRPLELTVAIVLTNATAPDRRVYDVIHNFAISSIKVLVADDHEGFRKIVAEQPNCLTRSTVLMARSAAYEYGHHQDRNK
jgi:hypothetical protein